MLHASANLARQRHDGHWRSSTLSAWRLAEEVQRCLQYRDLPLWLNRFAREDFLAIDDMDDIAHHSAGADFLFKLLELRSHARRRSLLTASLITLPSPAFTQVCLSTDPCSRPVWPSGRPRQDW